MRILLSILFTLQFLVQQKSSAQNVCSSSSPDSCQGSQIFPIRKPNYKTYAFLVSSTYSSPELKKLQVESENYEYFRNVKHETSEGRKDLLILRDALTDTKTFKRVKVAHASQGHSLNKQYVMGKIDTLFNGDTYNATLLYLSGQSDNKTGDFLLESRFDGVQRISLEEIYTKWISRKHPNSAQEFCLLVLDFSSSGLWIEQLKNLTNRHHDFNFSIYAATTPEPEELSNVNNATNNSSNNSDQAKNKKTDKNAKGKNSTSSNKTKSKNNAKNKTQKAAPKPKNPPVKEQLSPLMRRMKQKAAMTEFGSVFTKNIVTLLSNNITYSKFFERRRETQGLQTATFFGFPYKVYHYFGLPLFFTSVTHMDYFFSGRGSVVHTYKDGAVYEGEILQQQSENQASASTSNSIIIREGLGVLRYAQGRGRYEGQWKANKQHGRGVLFYSKGSRYEGDFETGKFNGYGQFFNASNGDVYAGNWKNDLREGYGIQRQRNNEVYEGEWHKDKKSGNGTLFYANGNHYQGEFKNDELHGFGKFTWSQQNSNRNHDTQKGNNQLSDVFEGHYVHGVKNGKGRLTFADGCFYDGEFRDNRFNGKGRYYWTAGQWSNDDFVGDWVDDKRTGYGVYKYSNGNWYDGQWLNSLRHGKGKFFWNVTRNVYEGDWEEDQMHGKGVYTYANGDREEGSYKKGKKTGKHRKITVRGIETTTVY